MEVFAVTAATKGPGQNSPHRRLQTLGVSLLTLLVFGLFEGQK